MNCSLILITFLPWMYEWMYYGTVVQSSNFKAKVVSLQRMAKLAILLHPCPILHTLKQIFI